MVQNLKSYVGRTAVYIESSQACAGIVESAASNMEKVTATFRLVPGSFMRRLRFFQTPGDERIEKILEDAPFGNTWGVMASYKEFFLEDDFWQACFLWGGGFRIFFQPSFVNRFLTGDLVWIDEFYGDDTDEDDADDGRGD